ncbi:SDR family NAD(P)-dependent oxidoreductase [Phycisphaera mikurensis]|uniref:Putative oxidoreductase n=1 Tax=Phycisphaera mikurensis (strain NBRC 102666 / KCTC 22515 / FYK2301M01) TaxID=1142394 RepID=I0IIE9_PHYMF|nr:SDR family NAD(P)-dependent oxidoreductase [Phycisphaera mikurensis]MBB6442399.1 NAD(P)-dependent dehydrogenase (short-subunit alcohol dehydrogenase family) [Phycisphaera mikurensis]BAM05037.1 putative oxidoreductase [Phycisphaera mikurensis NBRC 102666]
MDLKLNGKHALVTGSTKGIGFAIAERLLREGATVTVNGRSEGSVAEAVEKLRGEVAGADVHGVAADLSAERGALDLAAAAEHVAMVDVLVNNAGAYAPKSFEKITDEDWAGIFDLNVMSGVRMTRALLPRMKHAGWGRVVFISSESGVCTPEEMIHYGVTKSAQLALSRGLAKELGGSGITVNSVLPGPTWTEGVAAFVEQVAAEKGLSVDEMKTRFFEEQRPGSLIARFATPEEVADLVAFAVSPLASATTGATLRCEGGIIDSIV